MRRIQTRRRLCVALCVATTITDCVALGHGFTEAQNVSKLCLVATTLLLYDLVALGHGFSEAQSVSKLCALCRGFTEAQSVSWRRHVPRFHRGRSDSCDSCIRVFRLSGTLWWSTSFRARRPVLIRLLPSPSADIGQLSSILLT